MYFACMENILFEEWNENLEYVRDFKELNILTM